MADFRKGFLLTAIALAVSVGSASAQTSAPICTGTTGAVPDLRSEGQTELTGAIVLNCSGIPTGTTVNFDVTLNSGTVPITSRPANGTIPAEAEVIVQSSPGAGGIVAQVPGTLVSLNGTFNNDARFTGITFNTSTPTITITGIRANVNPTYVPLNTGGFGQVLAAIAVSNGSLPIQQTGTGFYVGLVEPGLAAVSATTSTGSTLTYTACAGSTGIPVGSSFTINIPENFPTAFKTQAPQGGLGATGDSESGSTLAPYTLPAQSATQFAVTLGNIPSGLTFYLPVTITSVAQNTAIAGTQGTATLVTAEGAVTPVDPSTYAVISGLPTGTSYIAAVSGTTYFYDVITDNPSVQETFTVPVYPIGTITSSTSAAPSATVVLAPRATVLPGFVPSFIALGTTGTLPTLGLQPCQTSLLFPYVTNLDGFDTGFSIAATGTDPFGNTIGGGTCNIFLYGANIPATGGAPLTLVVPSAGEGHTTLSAVAPTFQGYMVAVCPFQFAHGFAFITNGFNGVGNGSLAEGYLADVLTRTNASTNPESLGN